MKIPPLSLCSLGLLSAIAPVAFAQAEQMPPTPVIIVTDIGTDIDDSWAIALALRSPELEVKLVLTDSTDARYRAAVAAKLLEAAGRGDIPIAVGENHVTPGEENKTLIPWIAGYDLAKYPGGVFEDGAAALVDTIRKSARPPTIVAIGPVPTLAKALAQAPDIAARCRFVGMYGSFDVGYGGGPPSAEFNVKLDPAALRRVLGAPWRDILLTPLDTCGTVSLGGARYHALWSATGDPLLRALITSYCVFAPRQNWMNCDYFATRSTTLFDCVAVYLAFAEDLVETETIAYAVTDDGFTRRTADGPLKARVAIRWKNRDGFEALLAGRLLGR
jgi:inosine-uridine nucleoside N-ribohydrolase